VRVEGEVDGKEMGEGCAVRMRGEKGGVVSTVTRGGVEGL